MAAPLTTTDVLDLRRTLPRATGEERRSLLQAALGRPVRSPKALKEWHDLLLFLLAHPADADEHRMVATALAKVGRQGPISAQLVNSGLAGAPIQGIYSLSLVRWMLARWATHMRLVSVEQKLDDLRETLRPLLPQAEQESVDTAAADGPDLLTALFGPDPRHQLRALVSTVDGPPATEALRESLWARMMITVSVEGAPGLDLSTARAPSAPPFCHPQGLSKGVDLQAELARVVPPAVRLTHAQQQDLIDTARIVLAVQERETDPVTWAGAVELFDLGRGLRIALFHLDGTHRLPFDSYVGFMAFRNGVPLAYGGAWIFPGRSKVGINVFPALRGGESAWFFAQLLRLYHQRFGVACFEAENYQLGHGNADGLRSGAYWFYYRLGFRPMTAPLQRMADREFRKLAARKGHPVPLKLLKALVAEGLELPVGAQDMPVLDTASLSAALPVHVADTYGGDRVLAMRRALERLCRCLPVGDRKEWTPDERAALHLLALPLDLVDDLEDWGAAERKALAALIKAKGEATETRHQRLLQRHARLRAAWAKVAR